jgi:toxin YoeB
VVRRIIWTSYAEDTWRKILEFYIIRNGSKTYSRKLNSEIAQLINLIKKFPLLGISTDLENVRILIKWDFKIFYKITPDEILILLIWDCRQNPKDIEL